jgi:hypothetical protein
LREKRALIRSRSARFFRGRKDGLRKPGKGAEDSGDNRRLKIIDVWSRRLLVTGFSEAEFAFQVGTLQQGARAASVSGGAVTSIGGPLLPQWGAGAIQGARPSSGPYVFGALNGTLIWTLSKIQNLACLVTKVGPASLRQLRYRRPCELVEFLS